MTVPKQCIELIKKFEGFSAKPYYCPAGVLTIGYGLTIKEGEYANGISKEQASDLLIEYCEKLKSQILEIVKVPLSVNQLSALISFVYNVGFNAFKTSTLLKQLNKKYYTDASKEFLKWNHANGKILNGLTKRREAEKALFDKPNNFFVDLFFVLKEMFV